MKRTRILIIDDHPAMRHGLAQLIDQEFDFEVCGEAEDRTSALDAITRSSPDFILLDIALKDKSNTGLDLIHDIQTRLGDIPILVVSMHDEALYAERALRAGARGYLMKQEPIRQILVAIRQILAGGVYLSEAVNTSLLLGHVGSISKPDKADRIDSLSSREFEIFRLIGNGMQPREIAAALNLSAKTVESHRSNMRKKLGFPSARELALYAVDWTRRNP